MPPANTFTPKRILIIKLRHHGDVLLSTPVASVLKKAYPQAQIDALVYTETLDILRYNNDFTNLYQIDKSWKKSGIRKQLGCEMALLNTLRHNRYDLLIHLTENWRGALISRYCRPQKSISYDFVHRQRALWRRSFTDLVPWPQQNAHIVEIHLNTLVPLHLHPKDKVPLKLLVANKDAISVRQKLTRLGWHNQPYILIHPCARWFFKCWDDGKMAELITRLLEDKQTLVLTGGPSDAEQAMIQNIKQLVGTQYDGLLDLSGQLTLAELSAAITQAALFIGVDSVPMHMAAALNVPGVVLFGATKIDLWRPWGESITVIDARDFGEVPDPDQVDTNTEERYLKNIPVETVWQAVTTRRTKPASGNNRQARRHNKNRK